MRLTCPTCGATYEIDASVLPPGGRDVQCSNCGSTWFQEPPSTRSEPAAENAAAQLAAGAESSGSDPSGANSSSAGLSPSTEAAAVPSSAPRRRRPDQAVLDVLRQEREHEARQRASEEAATTRPAAPEDSTPPAPPPAADTQPEGAVSPETDDARRERARVAAAAALGRARKRRAEAGNPLMPPAVARQVDEQAESDTSAAITQALREAEDTANGLQDHPRDAMGAKREVSGAPLDSEDLLGQPLDPEDDEAGRAGSRRNLLPDIEEINSTLRPDEYAALQAAEAGADASGHAETRSGFAMGFSIVLLIALALVLLYSYAVPLANAVPALASPLEIYRGWGDSLRIALDTRATDLADWLTTSVEE